MVNDSQSLVDLVEGQLEPLLEQYQGVMVACSGHLDSMVLFDVFCEIANRKKNFLKGAIHINYNQRGKDSLRDQALVDEKAKNAKIPFIVQNWGGDTRGFSQEIARDYRRSIFQRYTDQGLVVALAHHEDDLAENVLFRTARGTSLGNLLGMSPLSEGYFRPFLAVPKAHLADWAAHRGLRFGVDSTNNENKYSRNMIRNTVIPNLCAIKNDASRNFISRAVEAQEWEKFILDELSAKVSLSSHCAEILKQDLLELPFSIQILAIRSMIFKLSANRGNIPRNSISDFLRRLSTIADNHLKSIVIPGGFALGLKGERIVLSHLLPVQDQARYQQTRRSLLIPPILRISHQSSSFFATDQTGQKYVSNMGESNFGNMLVLESFN